MSRLIAFINQSRHFAADQHALQQIAEACMLQLTQQVAPAWGLAPPAVAYYMREADVPAGADVVEILDDLPPADAASGTLAMHTEDGRGFRGSVYCTPIVANGGSDTQGANSISGAASHEATEMLLDPYINRECFNYADGYYYDMEAVDWVEGDGYQMANGVWVSNFLYLSAFDAIRQQPPYDYLGVLSAPFTFAAGGYWNRTKDGRTETQFGLRVPEWKRQYKQRPTGRGSRRSRMRGQKG